MARRKKNSIEEFPPYHLNPDIVFIDLYFKGQLIKPGTLLRVKHDRKTYIFERMCCNTRLNTEWVDLRCQENGDWLSVRPDKISGLVVKRSRRKKSE